MHYLLSTDASKCASGSQVVDLTAHLFRTAKNLANTSCLNKEVRPTNFRGKNYSSNFSYQHNVPLFRFASYCFRLDVAPHKH